MSNNQSVTWYFDHKSLSADQLLNIEHQVSTRTCPAKSKFRILALFFNLDFGLYVSEDKHWFKKFIDNKMGGKFKFSTNYFL